MGKTTAGRRFRYDIVSITGAILELNGRQSRNEECVRDLSVRGQREFGLRRYMYAQPPPNTASETVQGYDDGGKSTGGDTQIARTRLAADLKFEGPR